MELLICISHILMRLKLNVRSAEKTQKEFLMFWIVGLRVVQCHMRNFIILLKIKKNYPDPNELFENKGVDAVRFFLLNSVAVLADDVRFSERHVDEILKQFLLILWNTYSFFVMYANIDNFQPKEVDLKIKPK